MASCCITQGAQAGALWWPRGVEWGGKGGSRRRKEDMYTCGWFTLSYGRNNTKF